MALIRLPAWPETGLHAFLVGVSNYPSVDGKHPTEAGQRSGLSSLTSAARSASEVAAWLLQEYTNPDTPLASIRILLSPAEGEEIDPRILELLPPKYNATRAAVEREMIQFRNECRKSPANTAFIYLAGHGIQLNSLGAVVLLEDFAKDQNKRELHGAIDVAGCHHGFNELAISKQLWFSDACRQPPEVAQEFERLGGALSFDRPDGATAQASPLFLASSTGQNAYAKVDGSTIFSQALLWALRGGAATAEGGRSDWWRVGTRELMTHLSSRVKQLAGDTDQNIDLTGRVFDVVAQRFANPPPVDITVELDPADASPVPTGSLRYGKTDKRVAVLRGWPLRYTGPAGIYVLKVNTKPPWSGPKQTFLDADPPTCVELITVQR